MELLFPNLSDDLEGLGESSQTSRNLRGELSILLIKATTLSRALHDDALERSYQEIYKAELHF